MGLRQPLGRHHCTHRRPHHATSSWGTSVNHTAGQGTTATNRYGDTATHTEGSDRRRSATPTATPPLHMAGYECNQCLWRHRVSTQPDRATQPTAPDGRPYHSPYYGGAAPTIRRRCITRQWQCPITRRPVTAARRRRSGRGRCHRRSDCVGEYGSGDVECARRRRGRSRQHQRRVFLWIWPERERRCCPSRRNDDDYGHDYDDELRHGRQLCGVARRCHGNQQERCDLLSSGNTWFLPAYGANGVHYQVVAAPPVTTGAAKRC